MAGKSSFYFSLALFVSLCTRATFAFVTPHSGASFSVSLFNDRFNRDMEDRSRQKAQGQGGGEMAAGAILGGLVAGPFGVLFGAQIGANLGAKNAFNKAKKDEMERLGITQDMLDAAQECGVALEQSMEGLEATKASLETQQRLAKRLDVDAKELYEKATEAMTSGDEEGARSFLLKRNEAQNKLKTVLILCADENKRLKVMEENVAAIERRAMEVESLLQRTVSSKTRMDTSDFSVSPEDPLLQKFRDLGID